MRGNSIKMMTFCYNFAEAFELVSLLIQPENTKSSSFEKFLLYDILQIIQEFDDFPPEFLF